MLKEIWAAVSGRPNASGRLDPRTFYYLMRLTSAVQRGVEPVMVAAEVSGVQTVGELALKLSPEFDAVLRFVKSFDNFPSELSLVDVGVNEFSKVECVIASTARGPPP